MKKHRLIRKPPLLFPWQNAAVGPIVTDPQGSYTGIGENAWEIPVQDVDDL